LAGLRRAGRAPLRPWRATRETARCPRISALGARNPGQKELAGAGRADEQPAPRTVRVQPTG